MVLANKDASNNSPGAKMGKSQKSNLLGIGISSDSRVWILCGNRFFGYSKTEFHQWISNKYRWRVKCNQAYPGFVFLRSRAIFNRTEQKNCIIYPIIFRKTFYEKTILFPIANHILTKIHSKSLVKEKTHHFQTQEKQPSLASNSDQRFHQRSHIKNSAQINPNKAISDSTIKNNRDQNLKNLLSIVFGFNKRSNFSILHENFSMVSLINRHHSQIMIKTVNIQSEVKEISIERKKQEDRFDNFEETLAINQSHRPATDLILNFRPKNFVETMTASQRIEPGKPLHLEDQSAIAVRSLPGSGRLSQIDVNYLTDQVYQALERKIRQEKQRRGYH